MKFFKLKLCIKKKNNTACSINQFQTLSNKDMRCNRVLCQNPPFCDSQRRIPELYGTPKTKRICGTHLIVIKNYCAGVRAMRLEYIMFQECCIFYNLQTKQNRNPFVGTGISFLLLNETRLHSRNKNFIVALFSFYFESNPVLLNVILGRN